MIFEHAHLTIDPASGEAFEAAVRSCVPLFRTATGCRSMKLEREIERPDRYRLIIGWATVDDHVTLFRNSEAFAEWRALVGHFFTEAPEVSHSEIVETFF